MKQVAMMNMINKRLKINGVFGLEDEFIIAVTEDLRERADILSNSFDDFIASISQSILRNDLNYTNLFEQYKDLNNKIDYYTSDRLSIEMLDSKRDLMDIIQREYQDVIFQTLAMINCRDIKKAEVQYNILNKRLLKKVVEMIESQVDENNEILLEKNRVAFDLLMELFKDFLDEDFEEEVGLEELEEAVRKYQYISDSKELERIAKEKGYLHKSQNGSHRKYEHMITHKTVTIPMHNKDVNFGLSLAIQKQIDERAIA